MHLEKYILLKSGRAARYDNPLVVQIARRCGVSPHTVESIARGRRYASKRIARKIQSATDHIVLAINITKPEKQQ